MILLLQTDTGTCHLGIYDPATGTTHQYTWQADRQLARGLLAFIHTSLARHQADWPDVTGIGVLRGPGSFTGLRIGVATANALAYSLDVPVVGACGDDWQAESIARLASHQNDGIAVPVYGRPARITAPRK